MDLTIPAYRAILNLSIEEISRCPLNNVVASRNSRLGRRIFHVSPAVGGRGLPPLPGGRAPTVQVGVSQAGVSMPLAARVYGSHASATSGTVTSVLLAFTSSCTSSLLAVRFRASTSVCT